MRSDAVQAWTFWLYRSVVPWRCGPIPERSSGPSTLCPHVALQEYAHTQDDHGQGVLGLQSLLAPPCSRPDQAHTQTHIWLPRPFKNGDPMPEVRAITNINKVAHLLAPMNRECDVVNRAMGRWPHGAGALIYIARNGEGFSFVKGNLRFPLTISPSL